ncbi:hypothetical protein GOV05_04585 [Candidatus Woesearchaeota archaeon]|nr:hypothetical protein [Candidatus Woesearchaeota archaeon]
MKSLLLFIMAANPNEVPLDLVLNMKRQGLSNNQIVASLQREGYTQENVFNALTQADIKGGIENMPQDMTNQPGVQNPMGMQPQSMQGGDPNMQPPQGGGGINMSGSVSTEELIEAIIDEKWNDLLKDINKVIEWKDKAETRLTSMEQKVNDIKSEFDKLHQAIISKVGEYDKNILNVGTEVKAMEKVFQKVLPTFVDNINELSRITDNLKKKTGAAKQGEQHPHSPNPEEIPKEGYREEQE